MEVVDVHKKNLQRLGYQDFEEWAAHPNHVYIGRNMSFYVPGTMKSKWANPFTVKKYGLEESLIKYEAYIRSSKLYTQRHELLGCVLGCWCAPHPCHGDVLIRLCQE